MTLAAEAVDVVGEGGDGAEGDGMLPARVRVVQVLDRPGLEVGAFEELEQLHVACVVGAEFEGAVVFAVVERGGKELDGRAEGG